MLNTVHHGVHDGITTRIDGVFIGVTTRVGVSKDAQDGVNKKVRNGQKLSEMLLSVTFRETLPGACFNDSTLNPKQARKCQNGHFCSF